MNAEFTPKTKMAMLASTAMLSLILAPPARAQESSTPAAAEEGDDIVVTGSLISNPNLERSSPVNVTTADEIDLQQSNVAEEILREIPGVVANVGSAVNNGNGGSSYVDLRGLGSNRNLVLLDSVRLTPAELVGRVDLNNIPLALIERVDALTGAASTTYGADAITGVVNFITKQDFAGFELSASEQITQKGDGNVFRVDATIGANFDDDRGNAVFSIGYQQADAVYQGARSFSINSIESKQADLPGGSPSAVPSSFSVPGLGDQQINPAGQLVAPFAPFNFNPYNIFQTPFERFNMYGAARYEVSDAVEVYSRGLFSKNTVDTIVAPSGFFGSSVIIPVSNPFLPAAARATFCANNDFDANTPGVQTLTAAECNAAALATDPNDPNYRTFSTNLRRRTTEIGPRINSFTTTYFDYRIGARGAITDTINWDLAGSYGQSENTQTQKNYVLRSRVRDALLATDTTSCLSGNAGCVPLDVFGQEGAITPAMASYLTADAQSTIKTSLAQVRGTINGDIGWAVPWASDPVGFAIGGEYRRYTAEQTSDLLSQTPGELGGAGAASPNIIGGYDVYEAFGELILPIVQDKPFFENLTLEGGLRYSSYKVDAPGNPSFKTTTWKAGGSWEPVRGYKLRGNYSHAVRAPNIFELFSPVVTGLSNLSVDPCQGVAPLNNANLRDICLAQGAPAFTLGTIQAPAAGQVNATSGGNLALKPETANTYTFGLVLQPEFAPGLSFSVDYYNIKVKGAIATPTPNDAIAACFGPNPTTPPAGAAATAACTQIRRDPATGELNGDPGVVPGLFLSLSNLGQLKTDGIDVTLSYKHDIGFADLTLNFTGNYTRSSKFKSNAADPNSLNRECTGFYSANCGTSAGSLQPKFQFSQRTTLTFGDIDVSLLWRYIDGMKYEPQQYADELAAAQGDPANCPDPLGADPGACMIDPQFLKIKAAHYFDLTSRFNLSDNLVLTFGIQNLLDRKPPIVGNTAGSTTYNSGNTYPATYDALGRRFALGARLKF